MKLRRINASAIALYLMLALLNAGALLLLDHLSQRQQVMQQRQSMASRQTERFLEADRYLTNQVRAFVVTGDPVYERDYWQEAQVTRRSGTWPIRSARSRPGAGPGPRGRPAPARTGA